MLFRGLPKVTKLQKLAGLDSDVAKNIKDLKALKVLFGGDDTFDALAARWNLRNQLGRGAVALGQAVDLTNHGLTRSDLMPALLPGLSSWERFKEEHSTGVAQP
jgi:hypothetical protein